MEILGKRILLRPWKKSDAKQLVQLLNDKSIAKFTRVPNPYRLKHAKEFIRKAIAAMRRKEAFQFAIVSKESNLILGSIDLQNLDKRSRKAEIGYLLGKRFRKKGFMGEAMQLLLDFAFKKVKLNRVRISCSTKNEVSRKVIEKASAKFEGVEREGIVSGLGKRHDLRVYSVLAREFKRKDI